MTYHKHEWDDDLSPSRGIGTALILCLPIWIALTLWIIYHH